LPSQEIQLVKKIPNKIKIKDISFDNQKDSATDSQKKNEFIFA